MANPITDAPASSTPEILKPGEEFGEDVLDDGVYGVRVGDVVVYGSPTTLHEYAEAIAAGVPTPTKGTLTERMERAVAAAEPFFWAVIVSHFPEVTSGDFGPGESHDLATALQAATRLWLRYNHPTHLAAWERVSRSPVTDPAVRMLVDAPYPGAVLVYEPGCSPGDDSDGWAVMPGDDARHNEYTVVATAESVVAAFGPAPLTDERIAAAAAAINEGRCPTCFTEPLTRTGFCVDCAERLCANGDGNRAGLPEPIDVEAAARFADQHLGGCTLDNPETCLVCAFATQACPDCDRSTDQMSDADATDHRLMDIYVAVGCEGYVLPILRAAGVLAGLAAVPAEQPWPTGVHEAVCWIDGETFNPSGPDDLVHAQRENGQECGGRGRYVGTARPFTADDVHAAEAAVIEQGMRRKHVGLTARWFLAHTASPQIRRAYVDFLRLEQEQESTRP